MPEPGLSEFSSDRSAAIVGQRLSRSGDQRLAGILVAVVEHLHDLINELRPTVADWREAIGFLTEVGHASDDKRQEWVLLSDLLGVTALIEENNSQRPPGATPNTMRGPFYRPGAPSLPSGATISLDGVGEALMVEGRVIDLDGLPIAGAGVETWQANAVGRFENQEPDQQPDFNLRGMFTTDAEGRFCYRTVKPAGYRVPDDGPVGQLLGRLGYPLRRPAHLHFRITAEGFETLTTQVFDAGDPLLYEDAVHAMRKDLIGNVVRGRDSWELAFDFVMVRARGGDGR
jgi:protocatechuate 3,4-dioxygenase beta subunit